MSKELEALENIKHYDTRFGLHEDDYKIIETALKALEIIKEKGNFIFLDYCEYDNKYYIYDNEMYQNNEITKEEYDLLKEVFK